jgi:hypothetical protein
MVSAASMSRIGAVHDRMGPGRGAISLHYVME